MLSTNHPLFHWDRRELLHKKGNETFSVDLKYTSYLVHMNQFHTVKDVR